jgi:cytidine deaminase
MEFNELISRAKSVVNPRRLSESVEVAGVGAAVLTEDGNVYLGVCIDTDCSLGFCAEHSAIASMITAGENRIEKIVAVDWDGSVMPPCGRCRELIAQVHPDNMKSQVMVSENKVVILEELLPYDWRSR